MKNENDIMKNIINIYDNKVHSNPECQKIKEEWKKYCDCLNKNKICLKERQECIKSFNDYYVCYINNNNKFIEKK
jgi:hypothetical protein